MIFNKGFSLVELLVSMAIATLLMSVVIFNYSTFNDNLAISSAEQEIAIAIRQAQTFGINVRETAASSGKFDSAYGIYVDPQNSNNAIYLFVDKSEVPFGDGTNANHKYDAGGGCGSASTECIEKISLRNGVVVSNVCDGTSCYVDKNMTVTFLRPNPDADIYFINNATGAVFSSSVSTGKIELTSPKGKVLKVIVESTGQVVVE